MEQLDKPSARVHCETLTMERLTRFMSKNRKNSANEIIASDFILTMSRHHLLELLSSKPQFHMYPTNHLATIHDMSEKHRLLITLVSMTKYFDLQAQALEEMICGFIKGFRPAEIMSF